MPRAPLSHPSLCAHQRATHTSSVTPRAPALPSVHCSAPRPCRARLSGAAPRSAPRATPLAQVAIPSPHQQEEQQQQALVRVANLASAFSKVARRLPVLQHPASAQQVVTALRLGISLLDGSPLRSDGRDPITRAVRLCVLLAELAAVGLPVDADALAACVVAEVASHSGSTTHGQAPQLDHGLIASKLGDRVASLVHDILRVRTAPERTELLDDQAASALREWCIAFNDIVANVVEVVARWDALQHMDALPLWERQQLAVESLQVWAPLGHALGLGAISSNMEDTCFQVLFPESYLHTSEWLRTVAEPAEDALLTAQEQLLQALEEDARFGQLAAGCQMRMRTKSLFSMMKKLLRLGDMARGGRRHDQVFDLLGMRAVVQPRQDLPPDEAERLATQACYVVQEVAQRLWHVVPGRTKDYIARPKASGYASLHLTICMHSVVQRASSSSSSLQAAQQPPSSSGGDGCSDAWLRRQPSAHGEGDSSSSNEDDGSATQGGDEGGGVAAPRAAAYLELQVRTQAMDDRAEMGDASHAHYKGGLDARQARLLHDWSRELHARLRLARGAAGGAGAYKLLLPPSVVAQQVGAFSLLDSVDLEDGGAVVQLPPPSASPSSSSSSSSSSSLAWSGGNWYSGNVASSSGGSQGLGDDAQGGGVRQAGEEAAAMRPPPTALTDSPYASLFNVFDRDKNGRISLEELREQLRELGVPSWSPPAPPAAAPSSPPPPQPPALLHRGSTPGIITFDAAADAEAIDAWVRMTEADGQQQQDSEEEGSGATSALAQAPGFMTSQELTFQEFAQLLKQAGAVRDQQLLLARQQRQLQQQAENQ